LTDSAEEYLNLLEGSEELAERLDVFKKALVERGWDAMSAEQASIATMVPMLHMSMAHHIQMSTFLPQQADESSES
jgi:hypothetical protein